MYLFHSSVRRIFIPFFIVSVFFSNAVLGSDISGFLNYEGRLFFSEPAYFPQDKKLLANSFSGNIEFDSNINNHQFFSAEIFARKDFIDDNRTHLDIRELYYGAQNENVEVYVGFREIFWGVAESVHITNIINQTDYIEDIDGEEKLGQPMTSIAVNQSWGRLEFFALLGFRPRTFSGQDYRLRSEIIIDNDDIYYQSKKKDRHVDYAIRWDTVFNNVDLGLSYFTGTAREPLLSPKIKAGNTLILMQYYPQVDQAGIDFQLTLDSWIWKFELASTKEHKSIRNISSVAGFEYAFSTFAPKGTDLSAILEYQYDDREENRSRATQNDIVVGMRWALNDSQSSEVLALISRDLDYKSFFLNIEMNRRLGVHWRVAGKLRFFSQVNQLDPMVTFADDDYLQLDIKRYF